MTLHHGAIVARKGGPAQDRGGGGEEFDEEVVFALPNALAGVLDEMGKARAIDRAGVASTGEVGLQSVEGDGFRQLLRLVHLRQHGLDVLPRDPAILVGVEVFE
eukprot:CAMPEP_0194773508 /NCGR_PEP_ID=MMETSP0323_2-20130528/55052_1 /TAXON_ID=2866 ORGANISM="Crypthecodinium cohnii, Strain Seligo" /NCGR_SAMPLE_ID=MMETSP0323_2 /ASSEMBLY_ACC=CAM_ASM_000346 /LENGTH=103 /DNA_ID=CAMNT_0039708609 /DNA_START=164 /DNA_END=472 /DNA_ORIENTATION=-